MQELSLLRHDHVRYLNPTPYKVAPRAFALFSPSFRPFSLFSLALIWALGRGARPARSRPLPARRASPSRARVRPRDPREGDSHEAGFGALVYPRARAARQVSLSEFLFTTMHDLWRVEAPIAELS